MKIVSFAGIAVTVLLASPTPGAAQTVDQAVELLRLSMKCPVVPQTNRSEAVIKQAETVERVLVSWSYRGDGTTFRAVKNGSSRTHIVYENKVVSSDSGLERFEAAFSNLGMIYAGRTIVGSHPRVTALCRPDRPGCVRHDGKTEDWVEFDACSDATAADAAKAIKMLRGPMQIDHVFEYHGSLLTPSISKEGSIGFVFYRTNEWAHRRGYFDGDDLLGGSNRDGVFAAQMEVPSEDCDSYDTFDLKGPAWEISDTPLKLFGPHTAVNADCDLVKGEHYDQVMLTPRGKMMDLP